MEDTWIKNPHALYRRLPDEVREWLRNSLALSQMEPTPEMVEAGAIQLFSLDPLSQAQSWEDLAPLYKSSFMARARKTIGAMLAAAVKEGE